MLSLEDTFREKLRDTYRVAPIDLKSFHRKYKVCSLPDCLGMCCNGGSGFYMQEEADTIRELFTKHTEFFKSQGIPTELPPLVTEKDEETGEETLSTGIRDCTYPEGMLPAHWPATSCIFKRNDGACTLQVLSVEQGKPSWWFKPLACWMFPLELEHDGKPHIHVAHHSTDEYIDEEYAGFTGYTKCGAECPSDGKPAYEVLKYEIAQMSKMLDRDLMSEILSYKEEAA
jgi:hypothetical protein